MRPNTVFSVDPVPEQFIETPLTRETIMKIEELLNTLPEWAKDTRLNTSMVLSEAGSPTLNTEQIYGIALTIACLLKDRSLEDALKATHSYNSTELAAIQAAASLMAMNNVYYRFTHLVNDPEFSQLPARLRMNFMANPGVSRTNFELYSLAASILNACEACIQAHTKALIKIGLSKESIQSTAKIVAVINALSVTIHNS
jgi:lipoyl-dependent peroxiredoxin subunit D